MKKLIKYLAYIKECVAFVEKYREWYEGQSGVTTKSITSPPPPPPPGTDE